MPAMSRCPFKARRRIATFTEHVFLYREWLDTLTVGLGRGHIARQIEVGQRPERARPTDRSVSGIRLALNVDVSVPVSPATLSAVPLLPAKR